MRGFAHLEVRNTNRTLCNEAPDSQVYEYVRTWNAKQLIVRRMQFQVRKVLHTWENEMPSDFVEQKPYTIFTGMRFINAGQVDESEIYF